MILSQSLLDLDAVVEGCYHFIVVVLITTTMVMRILKLAKYMLNAQVEKDEGPEAETLLRLLIVVEDPD